MNGKTVRTLCIAAAAVLLAAGTVALLLKKQPDPPSPSGETASTAPSTRAGDPGEIPTDPAVDPVKDPEATDPEDGLGEWMPAVTGIQPTARRSGTGLPTDSDRPAPVTDYSDEVDLPTRPVTRPDQPGGETAGTVRPTYPPTRPTTLTVPGASRGTDVPPTTAPAAVTTRSTAPTRPVTTVPPVTGTTLDDNVDWEHGWQP